MPRKARLKNILRLKKYGKQSKSNHFYRPQRSWGKVIFSEACVKNSVNSGGRALRGRACVAGGCAWWEGHDQGDVHGRGGACVAGGSMCGGGGHA